MHSNEYEAAFGRFLMTKRRTRCFRWRGPRFRPVGWRRAAGRRSPNASSPFFARRQTPKSHKNLLCPAAEEISYFSN